MEDQSNIEDWILDYCGYDKVEKHQVEEFVQNNPEWETVFQSARHWDALLSDARMIADPDHDEVHLPYAVVTGSSFWTRRARPLQQLVARIHRRVEKEERLSDVRFQLEERIHELGSETSAIDHFESVTGQRFRAFGRLKRGPRSAGAPRLTQNVVSTGFVVGRKLVRGFTLLAGVYLILFAASTFRESPLERMAHLTSDDYSWTELGISTRGNDIEWERSMVNRYNEALRLARSSSRSFFGLFPTYRMDKLSRARVLLLRTISSQEKQESVPPGAYLTLAKLHFLLGDRVRSIDALRVALRLKSDAAIGTSLGDYESDFVDQLNEIF